MHIVSYPAHPRGVVMGRREDGAAVGTRPEMRPDPTGSMTGEIPPSADAAPRVRSNALRDPRAMAGLRSQALRPAARSWLTGVAGPRSRKRGPTSRRTPQVERRKARSSASHRGNGAIARRPIGRVSQTAHRGPRKPQRLPALHSPRGERDEVKQRGPAGADTKNTGDDSRLYARMSAAPWFRNRSVLIKMQIHAHH